MTISRKITHIRPNTTVAWHNQTTDPAMSSILKEVEDYIAANYPGINTVTITESADGLTQTIVSEWSDDAAQAVYSVTPLCQRYMTVVNEYYANIGGSRIIDGY